MRENGFGIEIGRPSRDDPVKRPARLSGGMDMRSRREPSQRNSTATE